MTPTVLFLIPKDFGGSYRATREAIETAMAAQLRADLIAFAKTGTPPAPPTLTHSEVKALLVKLRDAYPDRLHVVTAVRVHGKANRLTDVKPEDLPAVAEFARKKLAELPQRLEPSEVANALRDREASFNEDVLPADAKPLAPRELYGEQMRPSSRALPRMQEQRPWIGTPYIDPRVNEDDDLFTAGDVPPSASMFVTRAQAEKALDVWNRKKGALKLGPARCIEGNRRLTVGKTYNIVGFHNGYAVLENDDYNKGESGGWDFRRFEQGRPASLNAWAQEVHAANAHWWHDPATGEKLNRNMGEMLMLVVSELAECMEGERKNLMDDHLPKRKMAEVELADAVIRIGDILGSIPLSSSFNFKTPVDDLPANKGQALLRISRMVTNVNRAMSNRDRALRLIHAIALIEGYAKQHGYDLWTAVAEKREYNKHRADHKPEAPGCQREEVLMAAIDPTTALRLFREFVNQNTTQWRLGAGSHHHPMWALVAETLGDQNSKSLSPTENKFVWAENRKPLGKEPMQVHGTIKEAVFYNDTASDPTHAPCVKGPVYGDTKGRFIDGEPITTSRIEEMFFDQHGDVIVKTRFSVYRVYFKRVETD